ncbi:hypothetical protein CSC08_0033 [Escherichia coli]|nr:hypothetical protein CSC08_0033 [Escherichia coli]
MKLRHLLAQHDWVTPITTFKKLPMINPPTVAGRASPWGIAENIKKHG